VIVFHDLAKATLQAARPFLGGGARQLAPLSLVLAGTGRLRSGPGEPLGVDRIGL